MFTPTIPDATDPAQTAPMARLETEVMVLTGRYCIDAFGGIDRPGLRQMAAQAKALDLGQVGRIDSAGAWLVLDLLAQMPPGAPLSGAAAAQEALIATVRDNLPKPGPAEPVLSIAARMLGPLGLAMVQAGQAALALVSFLGQVIAALAQVLRHPGQLRLTSLVHHCQEAGLRAVPIVALMAFLIGVVLAFQGSAQLRQFGAEVFVVDLIAISILRELGILLTAIIVAGRSGSAFTAAIGSMKMREEIDAMRTLGLDPVAILIVPRVLALIVMLPALGLIANVAGLIGGGMMAWIELGVSPAVFQARLVGSTDVWHFNVGMIKAPFFALIIGIVGCYHGMRVGGDAESLGRLTSASVVMAIFMVIVADALFSIFFAIVGV